MTTSLFAMVTAQGTAAPETCLCSSHATPEARAHRERMALRDGLSDPPLPGAGWHDVTGNQDCACTECGEESANV